MVAEIPEGVYTMKNKLCIIFHNAKSYQKASKKIKTQMLNELSKILHLNRQYLASLLRTHEKIISKKGNVVFVADLSIKETSKRGRKRVYGKDIERALKLIWPLTGFASSKHLVAFIRLNYDIIFNHSEIKGHLSEKLKTLLLKISASTVDRLLKPYRDRLKLKKRYKGNPFSSNLKKSIKVEAWFDKPREPGYLEIDLVHHSGASGKGEFIYTLTATEVLTGWTELRPIRNKAMVWTQQALEDILKTMPVPIKRIH